MSRRTSLGASLIWIEFRKLFMAKRLGLAALVLLLGGLWLYPFQVLYLDAPFKDYETEIAVQMAEDYGLSIDAGEFEAYKRSLAPKIAEADAYIRSEPIFAAANLDSYERYIRRTQMANGGTIWLDQRIRSGPARELFAELTAARYLIERYEDENGIVGNSFGFNQAEKSRLADVQGREGISVLPLSVLSGYSSSGILYRIGMTGMLVTALLTMHIHIGDRKRGLGELQAVSKKGKGRLFAVKTLASLLLGTLVSATLLAAVLLAYRFSEVWSLMNADISGRLGGLFRYDLTFMQYVLVTQAAVLVLCWITALLTAFFSSVSPNYIGLIAAMALILFCFFKGDLLLNRLLDYMLAIGRSPAQPVLGLGILLLLGLVLTYTGWQVQKRRLDW